MVPPLVTCSGLDGSQHPITHPTSSPVLISTASCLASVPALSRAGQSGSTLLGLPGVFSHTLTRQLFGSEAASLLSEHHSGASIRSWWNSHGEHQPPFPFPRTLGTGGLARAALNSSLAVDLELKMWYLSGP